MQSTPIGRLGTRGHRATRHAAAESSRGHVTAIRRFTAVERVTGTTRKYSRATRNHVLVGAATRRQNATSFLRYDMSRVVRAKKFKEIKYKQKIRFMFIYKKTDRQAFIH